MLNFKLIEDKPMTSYSGLGVLSNIDKSWKDFERLGGKITPALQKLKDAGFGAPKAETQVPRKEVVVEKKKGILKTIMTPPLVEKKPLNLLKTVGQSIARDFVAIGVEAKEQLLVPKDKRAPFGIASYTPQTETEKNIFGTDEAINFRSIGDEMLAIGGEDFKQKWGKASIPLGVAMAGLDITPIGWGKKDAIKIVSKTIAKTDDVAKIVKILKSVIKGSDESIEILAKSIKNVGREDEVVKIINSASGGVGEAKLISKELEPLAKGANTKTTQLVKEKGKIKIHKDDLAEMSDFTDYASGELKLSKKEAHQIELDARRIAEKYGLEQPKTIKGLSNEFGRELEKQGFRREVPRLIEDKPTILKPTKQLEVSRKLEDIEQPSKTSLIRDKELREQSRLGDQVIKGQSPTQSKSLNKDYHIFGEKESVIKNAEKLLSPLEVGKKGGKIGLAKKFSKTLSDYWVGFNEVLQDDWYRVRKIVKEKGIKVSDKSDPYLKRELYFGRIGEKMEHAKDIVKTIDGDILATSKKIKIGDKQLADDVNKYLYYRHAPERNLALGKNASGITTAQAEKGLIELESLGHYKEIVRIADKLQGINNKTLTTLLNGQVIDKKLYDLLRKKYKNHIPLQRIFEETENVSDILSGKGLDVVGTGIKRAKGSEREVADIFNNIVSNYKQALIRTEKNRVDLATLKFARENEYFNGLFKEIKSSAIGRTFKGQPILKQVRDPQVLSLMENGKQVYLKINDTKLAVALKGVNRQKMDGVMRVIASFTRLYSGLMTRFNPEFAFPNKIRDLQEMAVYMASKKEIGFKGAMKTTISDPKSTKDVFDYLRGVKSEGANLYKELKETGGTTGGLGLSTRKQLDLDIESIKALNRKNPKKVAEKIIGYIDSWNTLFEDSTRLSVYKQGLKGGLSKERAAFLAKESTINFNRMGTAGPVVNGIYMFSNASIQGSVKILRAMRNPKVAVATIASVTGAVFATQEWNDSVDKDWRDKVSEWDRMNGLTVVLPTKDEKFNYITIPVSWGIKPINTMSNYAVDLMNDKKTNISDAMSGIFASVVDSYNPVGGTDFFSAITPTIIDLPLDITRNRKWSGNTIRPDWDKYAPMSEQYFNSLKETTIGKIAIDISEKTSKQSGGRIEISPADITYSTQQLIGGTGRFMSKIVNTVSDVSKGKVQVKEIPFVSRFLRSKDVEETGYGVGATKEIRDILTEQSRKRIITKRKAEAIYEQFKKMPKEQAIVAFNELVKDDGDMAKMVSEIGEEEKLGLNYTQRLMKQLGVSNGERAKYIHSQLNKLEDKESMSEYWKELVDKKIISKTVNDQILWLMSGKSIE